MSTSVAMIFFWWTKFSGLLVETAGINSWYNQDGSLLCQNHFLGNQMV
jgi:hypothetical protein